MEKDFEKLMKDLNNVMSEMGDIFKEFEKDVKKATGKTLDEIMAMPVDTPEEKKAFVDELMKVKHMMEKTDSHDFTGNYIKLTGGRHCTSFEASGSPSDLLHILCQGLATVIQKANSDEDKQNKLLELVVKEVKDMIKHMDII